MKLSKNLKETMIDRFIAGASVPECAVWYGKKQSEIEGVLRKRLKETIGKGLVGNITSPELRELTK